MDIVVIISSQSMIMYISIIYKCDFATIATLYNITVI